MPSEKALGATRVGDKPVKIIGKKIHVKSDGAVNVEASGHVQVKGKGVGIN